MSFLTDTVDLAIERDLQQFLGILLIAMGAASLPKIFAPLRQVPYTLLLVIVGLGLALVNVRLLHLSPGLILMVFLPPLLFEAGWNMRWSDLKQEMLPSLLYAMGGVLISIAVVGWALHTGLQIPWETALLIGSCLSATDSAAVLALFRDLGAEKRLTTLLEGESLFNDGASVVAYGVLVELALDPQPFDLSSTLLQFLLVSGIGLGIGGVIGVCVAVLCQRYELSWVEQSLTLVTAYGTYLLVEELGGSGVIGVVTAALVIGNFSLQPEVCLPKRSTLVEFWEFAIFLVNSILFLLLGDQILLSKFFANLPSTLIAVVAVVAARALTMFGFSSLTNWLAQTQISWQTQTVLWWTGLRGSVSIALALSLPIAVVGREEVIATSFGVVWFTLLVQGLTTQLLLNRLKLLEAPALYEQYLERLARRDALQAVLTHLMITLETPTISPSLHQTQIELIRQNIQQLNQEIEALLHNPALQAFSAEQQQNELVAIEAAAYQEFLQTGRLKSPLDPIVAQIFDRAD